MTRARNSANLASDGNLFVDIANDRTGIGSVAPAQNLHVAGTAGFHADTTFVGDLYNTTWDRSDNSLKFVDNAKAKFGTGGDLEVYHNGTNAYIDNKTNRLWIRNNTAGNTGHAIILQALSGQTSINLMPGGAAELYHANNKKFETTAYGTNTTGTAVNDGLVVAGVATVTTMNVTGVLTYDDVTSVDSVGIITARSGINITSGGLKIGTTTEGTVDSDDLTIATSGNTGLTIRSGTTSNGAIHFSDATSGVAEYAGYIDYDHNTDLFTMGVNSNRFLAADSNQVVYIGKSNFGGASRVVAYGGAGGIDKNSLSVLNPTASVAGRGAGVAVGGNTDILGSFYAKKSGNADSAGGDVFLESVGAISFITGGDLTNFTNNTHKLTINSSGNATFAGNVTINNDLDVDGHTNLDNVSIAGVTTVSNKTQVDSIGIGIIPIDHHHIHIESANPRVLIRSTGTNAAKILFGDNSSNDPGVIEYAHSSNSMMFNTGNLERLRIDGTGDLSLRTTTQNAYLGLTANSTAINTTLGSTTGTNPRLYLKGVGNGQSDAGDVFIGAGTGGIVNIRSAGLMKFEVNSDSSTLEALSISSAGEVAINDTAAVASALFGIKVNPSTHNGIGFKPTSNGSFGALRTLNAAGSEVCNIQYDTTNANINFRTSNSEKLRIGAGGGHKITCNESHVSANLSEMNTGSLALNIIQTRSGQTKGIGFGAIGSASSNTGIQAYDTSDNSANQLLINPFGGFVGINETSPDNALHVKSDTDTQQIKVENTVSTGRAQIRYVNPQADWQQGIIGGTTDGDFITYSSSSNKNIRFYTSNTERMRVKGNSNSVIIGNVSNTGGNTNSTLHVEGVGMNVESGYDTDDTSGSAPHLTLSGQSTRVRMDFGTMNVAPYAGFMQARFDNNPFGNSGTDDAAEPILINPRGGVLGYNIHDTTAVANVGGGNISPYGGFVLRAGRANSATVNNLSTAIKIYPAEARSVILGEENQGAKFGGIAWHGLDPHNGTWSGYPGHQCWMGMSYHSTPGQEFSNWQVQMNNNTAAGSYATNVAIQASPAGYVTTPSTPSFAAFGMSGSSYDNGTMTGGVGSHGHNIGNHYNTSTGIFTAPVAGRYLTGCGVLVQHGSGRLEGNISKNNSDNIVAFNGTGTTYDGPTATTIVQLAKNDTLRVKRSSGNAYDSNHPQHYFFAHLIG